MLRETDEGVELEVWVVAGASRNEVGAIHDGALRLRVAAPPRGGRANEAVGALISSLAGRRARVIRGFRSRRKTVLIGGATAAEVMARIGRQPGPSR